MPLPVKWRSAFRGVDARPRLSVQKLQLVRNVGTQHSHLTQASVVCRRSSQTTTQDGIRDSAVLPPQELTRASAIKARSQHPAKFSDADILRPVWDPNQWELTVGIEIHAQLHTERKLFSGKSSLDASRWLTDFESNQLRQHLSTRLQTPMCQ